jgi:hypothetical protein
VDYEAWKDLEGSDRGLIEVLCQHMLGGLRKVTKSLSQDSGGPAYVRVLLLNPTAPYFMLFYLMFLLFSGGEGRFLLLPFTMIGGPIDVMEVNLHCFLPTDTDR